jgi:ribonuclease R
VVEHLGSIDATGTDVAVVLRHYGIPEDFPPEVLAAAEGLPENPSPADWKDRSDLRKVLTVTIDGESARDFDDALTCEELGKERWRFGVHIADVSHYVTPGSALDREAYRRGTSVYYPERAVPMLPERLSNGLCSLRPGVPRLAMSVFLDVDADGRLLRRRFARSVIESDRRLTYGEVARVLEDERPGDAKEYGEVLPLLRRCRAVMEVLHAERSRRGSIDFDLPSGDVVLDTDGTTVGVTPAERTVAHRIVEEMMIAANEAVAEELDAAGVPALYRVHDAPSQDDLEGLAEVLGSFGIRLPRDLERLHPRHLQAALEEAEGKPSEPLVSTLVLRTMQRALYSPECRGHYALASRFYTHFTSPIRRYPDLVTHRQLAAWIAAGENGGDNGGGGNGGGGNGKAATGGDDASPFPLAERLDGIARHTSFTERRAESSERDLLQWKKVRFLADRVGETFHGRITGVQPFGLFVQLDDLHVDGLVPIRTLGDDYYLFEPESHRLVGDNQGRVFRLADPVEVRLAGVSLAHRGLDLEIADLEEPPRRRRGRRREGR